MSNEESAIRVKPLEWEEVNGPSLWWRASNPFGRLPLEATSLDERQRKDREYEQRVLSLLQDTPSPEQGPAA